MDTRIKLDGTYIYDIMHRFHGQPIAGPVHDEEALGLLQKRFPELGLVGVNGFLNKGFCWVDIHEASQRIRVLYRHDFSWRLFRFSVGDYLAAVRSYDSTRAVEIVTELAAEKRKLEAPQPEQISVPDTAANRAQLLALHMMHPTEVPDPRKTRVQVTKRGDGEAVQDFPEFLLKYKGERFESVKAAVEDLIKEAYSEGLTGDGLDAVKLLGEFMADVETILRGRS